VTRASERAAARGLATRSSYRVGDAHQLPFDDDSFDLVTCQTVLIHVDAARVVREMRRVCKPGGLVAVSEPDNLASTLALLNTSLATPADDVRALLELQQVCERGKAALGEGNSSVGALLPGMFAEAALDDVTAYSSDKCAMLLPPYDSPSQELDLGHHLAWYRDEVFFTGTENDSRRAFRAGGGEDARFDPLWACACQWMHAFVEAVEQHRFHGARGFVGYYISGRKPR
jgi:SAM-dependent methyltransferase